jgi:hypothetical protein
MHHIAVFHRDTRSTLRASVPVSFTRIPPWTDPVPSQPQLDRPMSVANLPLWLDLRVQPFPGQPDPSHSSRSAALQRQLRLPHSRRVPFAIDRHQLQANLCLPPNKTEDPCAAPV